MCLRWHSLFESNALHQLSLHGVSGADVVPLLSIRFFGWLTSLLIPSILLTLFVLASDVSGSECMFFIDFGLQLLASVCTPSIEVQVESSGSCLLSGLSRDERFVLCKKRDRSELE